jgi:RNase P subunit RPR2
MVNKLFSSLECSKCYETMYPIQTIKRSVNSQIVRYCCNNCGKIKSILKKKM